MLKRKTQRANRRLDFDSLEARMMLDGAVTARIIGGDLVVTGDEFDNNIAIDRQSLKPGEIRVTVDVSSHLNGVSGSQVFNGFSGSVRVRLLDGNDRLNIDGFAMERLIIDAGNGDDTIVVAHSRIKSEAAIIARDGNDSIHLVDSVLEDSVRIDAGHGNNHLVMDDSRFHDGLSIRARSGNDSLFLGSRFDEQPKVRLGFGRNLVTRDEVVAEFDFRDGAQGWEAGFSDYRAGDEEFNRLKAELRPLPQELHTEGTGFYLHGANHSDDLFMFLKRQLTAADGLEANTTYQLRMEVQFGSNAPSGCFGIGGSPGDSVFLKAGAGTAEPDTFTDKEGYIQLTVDKGNQATGGPAASVAGNIANGIPCDDAPRPEEPPEDPPGGGGPIIIQSHNGPGLGYVSIRRTHVHNVLVRTDANAQLWLLVGTDSGFEGPTGVYYQKISAQLTRVSDAPRPSPVMWVGKQARGMFVGQPCPPNGI